MWTYAWSWPVIALVAGIFIGVSAGAAIGILLLEAQRRRDQRASTIQDVLAAPIARELGRTGVSVLPVVYIPLWKSATRPAVIELAGRAPSDELHDRVIRLVEREAARLRYFRIEDRIRIEDSVDEQWRRLA